MTKPLKLALVGSAASHYIWPYVESLAELGHDVVLFNTDAAVSGSLQKLENVIDISCGAHAKRKLTKWKYTISAIALRSELKKFGPDIVHGHYIPSSGLICFLSGFRPYIISARGSDLLSSNITFIRQCLIRRILKASAGIHTVSRQLSSRAAFLSGFPNDKILTITQGIDIRYYTFRNNLFFSDPIRIICTRRLEENYNPITIVEACHILFSRGINFQMTFASGGSMKQDLINYVREMGIYDKVKFLSGYNNDELPKLLESHDIYVSASSWDGTSISLLEAMSSGLFPIVSLIESNLEWLEDNHTAKLFAHGNPKQLAESIIYVIENPLFAQAAVLKNRTVVETRANKKNNALVMQDFYYKMLGLI